MPTNVISKVGASNSPVVMDYSTLQSWEDAKPANLVTDDKMWIGECYDQGVFPNVTANSGNVTFGGSTTDATHYSILRCAAGAGFADKAGVRSTALAYNETTGAGVAVHQSYVYGRCITDTDGASIYGLQLKHDSQSVVNGGTYFGCIIQCDDTGSRSTVVTAALKNCLIKTSSTGFCVDLFGGGIRIDGCTIIGAGGGTGVNQTNYTGTRYILQNCAIFGFAAANGGSPNAASGYNATDNASIAGSNNQTSLTFASQFVNSTNDFRAVSSGSLYLNGTPDATNIPTDISGTTRSASTPTIGCWEVSGSSPSSSPSTSTSSSPSHSPSTSPSTSTSSSPSSSVSSSPSPSSSTSSSPSGSASSSPSASASSSPSASPSASVSASPSSSPSSSPSTSPSSSPSTSASSSPSPSSSPSISPSSSVSSSPSTSQSGSLSTSPSSTPSASASASASSSPSPSASTSSSPSTSPSGEAAIITIEGNCFTELGPGVNVDSTRTFQMSLGSVGNKTYEFQETEVNNG